MPFIGKPPAVGAYSVLDALTASATANYSLQLNGAAFVPNSVNQLLVSLNGVIQKPGSSFTVSGSTLTFKNGGSDQALTSSDSIDFIISMGGDPLNVGVVSDGTITNSKVANGIASSKLTGALPALDGSALTGIQAGVQTSVPKSVSGITTVLDLSKDDFKVTAAGITTIDVRGGSEGNSHTLRIHNSGITTVGFSTYFLFPSGAAPIIPTADGTISLISFTVDRQGVVGLATQLLAGSSVNFS